MALITKWRKDGTISLDGDIISQMGTPRPEGSIISLREQFQYGTSTVFKTKVLNDMKALCRRAIEQTKGEIY